jgi:meso-butanediol dehydrogenase / (S,S)-butanediol dehydrogenase / diacetyl reductase
VPTPESSRVALVTGGGSGIGAAVAHRLSATGWKVVICGRREESLKAVAERTGAVPIVCDIADVAQVGALVDDVVTRFARLDGLVLNAGVIASGKVGDLSLDDWHDMVSINLTGSFFVARSCLPHLLSSRGAVVSVASEAALRASSEMSCYSATKAGLLMLTQSLAVDYGAEGLRANVVCPGWTVTEMADEEMASFGGGRGLSVAEAYRLITSLVPLQRPARADEVASVIAFLLSDDSSYVNGAVIPVDGGGIAVDPATVPYDPRVSVD